MASHLLRRGDAGEPHGHLRFRPPHRRHRRRGRRRPARRCWTGSRPTSSVPRPGDAIHPVLPPAHAGDRGPRPEPGAVPGPDRGEPDGPARAPATRASATSSSTACCPRLPSAGSCWPSSGPRRPERVALSDKVCIALQLVEHLQDIGEDARRGRIYMPAEDMAALRVRRGRPARGLAHRPPLRQPRRDARCRRAREPARRPGRRSRASLPLRPRAAVAGFVAGGLAALDSIDRAGNDVLGDALPPRQGCALPLVPCRASWRRARSEGAVLNTDLAYDFCEAVTRQEAKNFAYGIRLLKRPERRALSAVYALARRIDDIGDGTARARAEARRPADDPQGDRPDRSRDQRPGARRRGRRRRPLRPCHVVLRRDHRRLRDGRRRHALRDDRRSRRLLPQGRRLGRPALAGRVRLERHRAGGPARRLPRRRPPADQHPARRRRGPLRRACLPAASRRRVGRLRRRCSPAPRRRSPGSSPSSAGAPRSGSPRACSCSACSTAAAGPASPPWPGSTGACSCASSASRWP